ncbi:N-acetylmuramoyl-L-alanine amidase-like domain-containing protein [Spirosoma areae]
MMNRFTLFLVVLTPLAGQTQDVLFTNLTNAGGRTPIETSVQLGKRFLGKPYVSHTLDQNPTEQLVVNVGAFDCTTYIETVLALSLAWHGVSDRQNQKLLEQSFRSYLTKLRYRDSRVDGYGSRLHYFSDWLRTNERKGLLSDVTHELPGNILVAKPLSYMTSAVYNYPQLHDSTIFKQVALTEASLSQQSFSFIPKKNIRQAEAQLQEGDIVMLTAARPGLDMKHVGLAVRQPNGRIHLMHASSDQGAVVVTRYPLSNYVLWHKQLSGIRVARLRPGGALTTIVLQDR